MVFRPFGNETTLPPAAWHPEPQVRGTFSILSTSLLTLFLCVWTVVHTNVPEYEDDRKLRKSYKKLQWLLLGLTPATWRKIGYMVMAILAPELVAWNAFEQRRKVKATTRKVREYLGDDWTDTHSWFASMGGFAFDISGAPQPFFPAGRRRLTITRHGIEAIAKYRPHLLQQRSLTRDQIRARGRADELTKFLACWQAAWFCAQCIFRLSSGLAITLLELNVFGHAVCALLIYVLWWDKLQGVTEPYVLTGRDTYQIAATLCTLGGPYNSETGHLITPASSDDGAAFALDGPAMIPLPVQNGRHYFYLKFTVAGVCWQVRGTDFTFPRQGRLHIDEYTLARLGYRSDFVHPSSVHRRMLKSRCRDWSINLDDIQLSKNVSETIGYLAGVILASAIYGGLHLTAFGAMYPSPLERLLWRISSLTVTVFGLWFAFIMIAVDILDNYIEIRRQQLEKVCYFITGSVLGLSLLLFIFCRTFLVVECFISMAHLSPSHLAIPNWSAYVPHIS